MFGHAELNKEMRIPQAKGSEPASLELISMPSLSMPNTDSKLQIMLVHDLPQELDDQAKKVWSAADNRIAGSRQVIPKDETP